MSHFYKIRPDSKITAWSYSRYDKWKSCPFKFYLTTIEKRQEPKSSALDRGLRIHDMAERYVDGRLEDLPDELTKFREQFEWLRSEYVAGNVDVEENEAYTDGWEETEYFGHDTWLRVKKDARIIVEDDVSMLVDYKTGKKRDSYMPQLELYAATETVYLRNVKRVFVQLWFTDIGPSENVGETFNNKETAALRKDWARRVRGMFNETRFDPKPSTACRWCHFRRDNGGPCIY